MNSTFFTWFLIFFIGNWPAIKLLSVVQNQFERSLNKFLCITMFFFNWTYIRPASTVVFLSFCLVGYCNFGSGWWKYPLDARGVRQSRSGRNECQSTRPTRKSPTTKSPNILYTFCIWRGDCNWATLPRATLSFGDTGSAREGPGRVVCLPIATRVIEFVMCWSWSLKQGKFSILLHWHVLKRPKTEEILCEGDSLSFHPSSIMNQVGPIKL